MGLPRDLRTLLSQAERETGKGRAPREARSPNDEYRIKPEARSPKPECPRSRRPGVILRYPQGSPVPDHEAPCRPRDGRSFAALRVTGEEARDPMGEGFGFVIRASVIRH